MKIKRLLLMLSLAVAIPWAANAQTTPILPQHGETGNQDASETTVTQTIALNAGVNWVSFNVETNLVAVKDALVAALPGTVVKIQSKNQNTSYNPSNNRWNGRLNTLDMALMYKITVTTACEIALQGQAVAASEHSVSIASGSNWIAFPYSTSLSVTNAFAGFAVNDDVVQSKLNNAKYNASRNRWNGQLSTLQPGQGYIYKSASAETRVFTYPTVSK